MKTQTDYKYYAWYKGKVDKAGGQMSKLDILGLKVWEQVWILVWIPACIPEY
jgi:hypothetical protein